MEEEKDTKKQLVILGMAVLLLAIGLSGCVEEILPVKPKTIYVDDDGTAEYTNIQDAVDAAGNGDTVYVYKGTYVENLVINKSISLIGENKNNTIIDGDGLRDVIYIKNGNINISGFTVNGGLGTRAIKIISTGNKVTNNILINSSWGVYLTGGAKNIISRNIIADNLNGIDMWNSDNCSIDKNDIYSHNKSYTNSGLYIYSCNSTYVLNNTIHSYGIGFQIISSNNLKISGNKIYLNGDGLNIAEYSSNNIISFNNFSSNTHNLYFNWCNYNIIYCNNFFNSTYNNAYENRKGFTGQINNSWDYNHIGNYWDDYNGTDSNGDGIGDTPYIIPGYGINDDKYPLMNPVDI